MRLWVWKLPLASLISLPIWPIIKIRLNPIWTACSSINPMKLLVSAIWFLWIPSTCSAKSWPIRPGTRTAVSQPLAFITFNWGTKEFLNPSSLIGFTMPVVPIMEIPPSIPRVWFNVFLANTLPLGTLTVTVTPWPWTQNSSKTSFIIARGPGLMAGSPGGIARPGFVTVPTPKPARKRISPESSRVMVVSTSLPCVTSGSSPPSFITVALASVSDIISTALIGTSMYWPCGFSITTLSTIFLSKRANKPAFIPAVAHEPVVYPPFMSSTLIGPPTPIGLAIQRNQSNPIFYIYVIRNGN